MIREKARDGKEAAMTELFCEGKAAVGVGRPHGKWFGDHLLTHYSRGDSLAIIRVQVMHSMSDSLELQGALAHDTSYRPSSLGLLLVASATACRAVGRCGTAHPQCTLYMLHRLNVIPSAYRSAATQGRVNIAREEGVAAFDASAEWSSCSSLGVFASAVLRDAAAMQFEGSPPLLDTRSFLPTFPKQQVAPACLPA
ncbi:hypothetical protein PANT_22c00210 [Moesziomyces antarcticus T-34]|uniref:Uncharacterized protein n=1 Tax=Pseudozyma antarctica (strain T-34) TaxID=1151754 RepID=M9M733_PSEA3|nr:hypothetical protein PANT_22c00210 [Moesziomyces antarcticus T-34]